MTEVTGKDELSSADADQVSTTRKKSARGFAAMQAYVNKSEPISAATPASSSPLDSPAFRNRKADRVEATFQLALPVTKQLLEMQYKELDPRDCFPSSLNPRVQSLLSLTDPDVAMIKDSWAREGQREPVKARLVVGKGGKSTWEIVEGTTRLFIANAFTLEQGAPMLLKAWVGDIPDADVRRLAKAENRERRDLSPWETSKALEADMETIYKGRTQEYVGEQEGRSQKDISNLLKLALLDELLVKLVVTPGKISVKAGIQAVDLWAAVPAAEQKELLEKLSEKAPYSDAASLVKEFKQIEVDKALAERSAKYKPILVESKSGAPVARLSPHRTNAGQYKLDMFDFNNNEAMKVLEFIKKLRGV